MKKRAAKKKAEFDKMQEERRLEKELKWRKGLMARPEVDAPADVLWSGLGDWKETIAAEQKAEGGGKSKTKQDMEDKARKSLLNKVHNAITDKLMVTLTEISSKLMTMTEGQIRAADEQIGAVVNALNGVIMTYHMGKALHSPDGARALAVPAYGGAAPGPVRCNSAAESGSARARPAGDKKRYLYLRRYASDKLTELIASVLDEAADVTEKTKEMNEKISGIIESKKGDASQMMNDKISEVLASSGPRCFCIRPTVCQSSLRFSHADDLTAVAV